MCTNTYEEPNLPSTGSSSHVEHSPPRLETNFNHGFGRLYIHLNMVEHAYIQPRPAPHFDSHSVDSSLPSSRRTSATPTSIAYTAQDLPPTYAPVTSFNYASYDSPLPTPVSVAGSPSMQERNSKMLHGYSQNGDSTQQPTPPGTSRPLSAEWQQLCNYQSNPMSISSNHSSPLAMPPPATDMMDIHPGLETSHTPEENACGLAVSSADQPYWGAYGVSGIETQEDISPQMSSQALFMPNNVAPSALQLRPPLMGSSPMPLPPALPQLPMLRGQPNPGDLGPAMTPTQGFPHSYNGLGAHSLMENLYSNSVFNIPKRTPRGKTHRKRQRAPSRALSSRANVDEHANTQDRAGSNSPRRRSRGRIPYDKITLNDKAKPEDRYLFETRLEMEEFKGKGMWDRIVLKWGERHGKKDRAALQMQLARAVQAYAIWPKSEDEALRKAVREFENNRHSLILKYMKQNGGCVAWEWKENNIAKRLVELDLDDPDLEDNGKSSRRKRKQAARQQQSWNLCVSQMEPGMAFDYTPAQVEVSDEQDQQLFEMHYKAEPESPESMGDILEHPSQPFSHSSTDMDDLGQSQSARVAQQAVQQLANNRHMSDTHLYNNHS